jgi:hypothetical protein
MPKLIATKSMTYATRRLIAGDEFVAKPRHARVLVAIGKAKSSDGTIEPPKKTTPKRKAKSEPRKRNPLDHDLNDKAGGSTTPEAMAKLRADYLEVVGKKPFPGWGAAELQKRIDEALAS